MGAVGGIGNFTVVFTVEKLPNIYFENKARQKPPQPNPLQQKRGIVLRNGLETGACSEQGEIPYPVFVGRNYSQ